MGLIKKLIGGIFSLLGGIFSIFKKSEYFLEDDSASSVTEAPAPAPTQKEKIKKEKALETAAPESLNGKVAAPVTPAPAPAPAKVEPVAPQPTQAATALFSPNYLVTAGSATSRRRPGPSLNRFMDMAKQVKS